jgi:hypothetical protein
MGEEDAICLRNYTKNVKCKSLYGELLVMTIQDFFQRVKPNNDSWNKIVENSSIKQKFQQAIIKKKIIDN